jgi:hypothetical protein
MTCKRAAILRLLWRNLDSEMPRLTANLGLKPWNYQAEFTTPATDTSATNTSSTASTSSPPIRSYTTHRQLRWLGHVARMPPQRLPRKLLTCWAPSARPVGRPLLTYAYAEAVRKALRTTGIGLDSCLVRVGARPLALASSPIRHLTSPDKTKLSGSDNSSVLSSPSVSDLSTTSQPQKELIQGRGGGGIKKRRSRSCLLQSLVSSFAEKCRSYRCAIG